MPTLAEAVSTYNHNNQCSIRGLAELTGLNAMMLGRLVLGLEKPVDHMGAVEKLREVVGEFELAPRYSARSIHKVVAVARMGCEQAGSV